MFAVVTSTVTFAKAEPAQIFEIASHSGSDLLHALFGLAWLADTFIAAKHWVVAVLVGPLIAGVLHGF